ncbi:MAG: PEGA domain-containing protein [Deltaproteobacteria bacterium]|nr:PEGA domain-containing protein [Deltaproteobacteria bacterium]
MHDDDCKRAIQTDLKLGGEQRIDPDELLFYEQHIASCDECRAEKTILDIIGGQDGTGALDPLDELSRHRLVDELQGRVNQQAAAASLESRGSSRARRYRVAGVVLGLAAAACIALAFTWWSKAPSGPEQIIEKPAPPSFPTRTVGGRILLVAGEVVSKERPAALGASFGPGDKLTTAHGRAVAGLPTGITLSLGPDTRIESVRHDDETIEVRLEKGRILASVDPGRKGPIFTVVTREGRIEVKGTIFSVIADEKSVTASVLRGEVDLVEQNRRRRLRMSEETALGSSSVDPISENVREKLQGEIKVIEMLEYDNNSVIDIQSVPKGADVAIDGTVFGMTPLSASIRPGHRQLALSMEGHEGVKELLSAGADTRQSRVFDLTAQPAGEPGRLEKPDYKKASRPAVRTSAAVSSHEEGSQSKQLFQRIKETRSSGNWSATAESYEELIRLYPSSDEARVSLVSLGEIQLEKLGNPSMALEAFNKYLRTSGDGVLAQEALYGKANAHRALGHNQAERDALLEFRERFPRAIQNPRVKRRLKELEQE